MRSCWPLNPPVTLLLAFAIPLTLQAQVTAIKAGTLIDPETGSAAKAQVILVEGAKVTAVGAGLTIPAGATVIDLSSSTVLPGLFDAHTHLCMTVNMRRDAGSYYYGQFQLQPDKGEVLAVPEYYFADTRDELLKAVRENIHYGATVIKLVVDDQKYIFSTDDIRFVVAEAAKSGLKVAAHVWTRQGAHNAALAGVASLEHLNGIADEDLAVAKRNGVTAVFTP
ncbi:MAG: amidohydrolase family protein, partial [Gemmatimonadales bacterium]